MIYHGHQQDLDKPLPSLPSNEDMITPRRPYDTIAPLHNIKEEQDADMALEGSPPTSVKSDPTSARVYGPLLYDRCTESLIRQRHELNELEHQHRQGSQTPPTTWSRRSADCDSTTRNRRSTTEAPPITYSRKSEDFTSSTRSKHSSTLASSTHSSRFREWFSPGTRSRSQSPAPSPPFQPPPRFPTLSRDGDVRRERPKPAAFVSGYDRASSSPCPPPRPLTSLSLRSHDERTVGPAIFVTHPSTSTRASVRKAGLARNLALGKKVSQLNQGEDEGSTVNLEEMDAVDSIEEGKKSGMAKRILSVLKLRGYFVPKH
ncbi:hypothetical protein EJ08DRAFT_734572 [Tothia fuscella]|uniref:Uncharacterized protein n=1 Tax=Tothia fuscella TaxID=1048955 RepID=A0A9P4TYF1_9PEZI|nr:hypothetical protein EJ08DRAFT_734572 [Tothia fuscella]